MSSQPSIGDTVFIDIRRIVIEPTCMNYTGKTSSENMAIKEFLMHVFNAGCDNQ